MNFWFIVRIAGIAFGVATLLKLATTGWAGSAGHLFQLWIDNISNTTESSSITSLIQAPLSMAIKWVRTFGINVPELQDFWRSVFALSTVVFITVSRYSRSLAAVPWAFILALLTAVSAGLNGNVYTTTGMGMSLFFAAHPDNLMGSRVAPVGISAAAGFSGFVLNALELTGANPIVGLSAFVISFGIVSIVYGLATAQSSPTLTDNRPLQIGLDVLFVMLGALGIASLLAEPPIW